MLIIKTVSLVGPPCGDSVLLSQSRGQYKSRSQEFTETATYSTNHS